MSNTVTREQVEQMIAEAIRAERQAMAQRVREVEIYGTAQYSSDSDNPFPTGETIMKEDAVMFRNDIANAIEDGGRGF